ncbi:unnamed protein product [Adineta steineri]|uniref:Uncharacterized protein n=1 Tax=Adineta steineri TaxID=433720 RepID=A0A813RZ24_9BILA|nr:unnamed protein product [Adineta steineri]
MIVEALNDYSAFLFQFAPYTDNITQTSDRSCLISYFDYSQFIYAIALGINQSTYDIFFVGEMIDLDKQIPLENRTFVGILSYTGSLTTIDCDTFYGTTQFIPGTFVHQEHLVMVTDSIGSVAYDSSEIYDPSTGTWNPSARLSLTRASHTTTMLNSGKVLVTGGEKIGS